MTRILKTGILAFCFLLLRIDNGAANDDCKWRHNLTVEEIELSGGQVEVLEDCLYYYLKERADSAGGIHSLILNGPVASSDPLLLNIESVVIDSVHSPYSTYSEFVVVGNVYMTWLDRRLRWEPSEWHLSQFSIRDAEHHIWKPELAEQSSCSEKENCFTHAHDVLISSDGTARARLEFRLIAQCHIDFTYYPEDVNECCLQLVAYRYENQARFQLDQTGHHGHKEKSVTVGMKSDSFGMATRPGREKSDWVIQNVETKHSARQKDGAEVLQICLNARRNSGTLKLALSLPVTIATIVMLVSPLFGEIRLQLQVKMFALGLQTICFLFLCSLAPNSGFGQIKPKIYTFYETTFILTLLSFLVSVTAGALARMKHKVPPAHWLFLSAKLINEKMCCTPSSDLAELERASSYQLQVDNAETPSATPADYTTEWRQILTAANNLFSGLCLTVFLLVGLFTVF